MIGTNNPHFRGDERKRMLDLARRRMPCSIHDFMAWYRHAPKPDGDPPVAQPDVARPAP